MGVSDKAHAMGFYSQGKTAFVMTETTLPQLGISFIFVTRQNNTDTKFFYIVTFMW